MTLAYFPFRRKNYYHHFFWIPRGETRWGDGGPLQAVAAPLTPRSRGTIYEALALLFLDVFEKEQDMVRLDFHAKGFSQTYPTNFR